MFVDNADEALKPRLSKGPAAPSMRGPSDSSVRGPSDSSVRGQPPERRPKRPQKKSSGSHPRPPNARRQHQQTRPAERPRTRRVGRASGPGGSGSVRIPAPALERKGPDPHLRIDGDTSGRPYCLVSPVLKEPVLLSREKPTIIGRGEESDVRVRSNLVSREHAEVRWSGDAFAVADLGSTNGSFLNGYPLKDKVPLRDGDMIYVGNFEILVKVLSPGDDPEAHLEGMTRKFLPEER